MSDGPDGCAHSDCVCVCVTLAAGRYNVATCSLSCKLDLSVYVFNTFSLSHAPSPSLFLSK